MVMLDHSRTQNHTPTLSGSCNPRTLVSSSLAAAAAILPSLSWGRRGSVLALGSCSSLHSLAGASVLALGSGCSLHPLVGEAGCEGYNGDIAWIDIRNKGESVVDVV